MLRRKLLLILGSLVAMLVASAIAAIWLLQGVLGDLNHLQNEATVAVEHVSQLNTTVTLVEVALYELQAGTERRLDPLINAVEHVRMLTEKVGNDYVIQEPQSQAIYQRIGQQLPVFERHVGALATAQDPDLAAAHNQASLRAVIALKQDILLLSRYVNGHAHQEQDALTARFRWLVLGLGVAFLLVINISIIVLLRTAEMILKPVDALVEASRQLGQEHFEHRVRLNSADEFDELARAYNSLAEQLQANEQRKLEMMAQVAVTLNHELNNAISIIELQLRLLDRQTNGNAAHEKCLREIRQSLERMTGTVEALKRVRRIVLTDYVAGLKMLDLQRSTEEESSEEVPG